MGLFSAINSSISGLNVATLGLQVVANNVANANTPGFATQTLDQAASMAIRRGGFFLGTGVTVAGISQSGSQTLERQLREAINDADSAQVQSGIYRQLEAAIGELGENDISSHMNRFFNALQEVAQQPESMSVRGFAIQQGQALTDKLNFSYSRTMDLHQQVNREISQTGERINQLLDEVASLNTRITAAQGSAGGVGAANNLMDTRRTALRELGSLIDIRVVEQQSGGVSISTTAGSALLINADVNRVEVVSSTDAQGYEQMRLRYADSDVDVQVNGGRMVGLQTARSFIAEEFLQQMNDFTQHLVYEFNKLHASGQGLSALTQVQGEHRVQDPDAPLTRAGLTFPPNNGSFSVHLRDKTTGEVNTHQILVQVGGNADTTLASLSESVSALPGLQASVDHQGRWQLATDDPNVEFYFSDDSSGVLASLGVNTFFTGTRLGNLGVNASLRENPGRLTTSTGGIGNDVQGILGLVELPARNLPTLPGRTLRGQYEMAVNAVAQRTSTSRSLADAFAQYAATLEAESLSQTGVNLDEEAAKMLQYQRAYQASARVIQTANDIFDVMLQL
jgi:flagellar hook-associated protein 1